MEQSRYENIYKLLKKMYELKRGKVSDFQFLPEVTTVGWGVMKSLADLKIVTRGNNIDDNNYKWWYWAGPAPDQFMVISVLSDIRKRASVTEKKNRSNKKDSGLDEGPLKQRVELYFGKLYLMKEYYTNVQSISPSEYLENKYGNHRMMIYATEELHLITKRSDGYIWNKTSISMALAERFVRFMDEPPKLAKSIDNNDTYNLNYRVDKLGNRLKEVEISIRKIISELGMDKGSLN